MWIEVCHILSRKTVDKVKCDLDFLAYKNAHLQTGLEFYTCPVLKLPVQMGLSLWLRPCWGTPYKIKHQAPDQILFI